MQNFQQILTEAAQLKEHQLKRDRKGYQSLPEFLKAGLGFNKKYDRLRKQNFLFQYRVSNKIKQEGNALFKQSKIEQALNKYEQALAIFRYIQSRTYENLKDDDLSYHSFNTSSISSSLGEKFESHMIALYLNICSCLTKLNKKQDAIYSAEQALKIKKTAKGHYKKAQAYLKFVNRDANDIKLGILELKEAYAIQKSEQILRQMYAAKEGYQKDKQKSKNWFKFMFDKNKKNPEQQQKGGKIEQEEIKKVSDDKQIKIEKIASHQKNQLEQLQKASKLACEGQHEEQMSKFEKTKQKLKVYVEMGHDQWQYNYQKDFVKRHGSKIYSILKIYQYDELANQIRMLMARCYEKMSVELSKQAYGKVIDWIKKHEIQKISKYMQRYELQCGWIKQNRIKMIQKTARETEAQELGNKEYQKMLSSEQQQRIQETFNNIENRMYDSSRGDADDKMQEQKQGRVDEGLEARSKGIKKVKNGFDEGDQRKSGVQRQQRLSLEEKRKYIVAAIVLTLILIRFLFF